MKQNCEVCGKEVKKGEIFFHDHNQKRDVAYHRKCYTKKFNVPTK